MAAEQYGLQQLAILRAQLAALKADETLSQTKMLELLKTYQEFHPEVVALQRKLDRLRAQEGGLEANKFTIVTLMFDTGIR